MSGFIVFGLACVWLLLLNHQAHKHSYTHSHKSNQKRIEQLLMMIKNEQIKNKKSVYRKVFGETMQHFTLIAITSYIYIY